jgi:uncharacterized protein (TIGR02646 family)
MRYIQKGNEPISLATYRASANATYESLPSSVKTDIKNQLLEEQGHTCAYCMQIIKFEKMKIEHWLPQSVNNNKTSTLDYKNLIGCCEGNEKSGNKSDVHTCDTKKANNLIKYSPVNSIHRINDKVSYLNSGKIKSTDFNFNSDIDSKLNLNLKIMIDNRKSVLDNIKLKLTKGKNPAIAKSEIQKILTRVRQKNTQNKYIPFRGIAINYLEKRLTRKS